MLAWNCAVLCALCAAMILPTLLMIAAQFDAAKNSPGANVAYAWKANGPLPRHVTGVRDTGRSRQKYVTDSRTTGETVLENVVGTGVAKNLSAGLAGENADRVRGANRSLSRNVTGIRSKVAGGNVVSVNVTAGPAVYNDRDSKRDARQVEQRNERCAAMVPLQLFGDGDLSEFEDVSGRAYASRAADRYRIRPVAAAFYDNSVVRFRRVRPVPVYVQRRPVVVFDGPPERRPTAADAGQQLLYYDVPVEVAARTPVHVGSPHPQNVLADDVRSLLQRVFSEGVTASQAAAEGDRKPKTRR